MTSCIVFLYDFEINQSMRLLQVRPFTYCSIVFEYQANNTENIIEYFWYTHVKHKPQLGRFGSNSLRFS